MIKTPKTIAKRGMMNKLGEITSVEETKQIWKEYIEDLYQCDINHGDMNIELELKRVEDEKGPRI